MSHLQEIKPRSGIGRASLAYSCSGLGLAAKSILVYLSVRYSEQRKCTWVSIGSIGHSCSMSPTCVKDNLKVLVKEGLIKRELRDESVKKSRKTIILWDVIEARAVDYRPKLVTPPAIIAADAAIAETLDEEVKKVDDEAPAKEDKYALTDEIIALLKTHFGAHPTFREPDWSNMMKTSVHACINEAGAGDLCLGVLTQICTFDKHEGTRKSVGKSRMLGGYIRQSFPGWFLNWSDENRSRYEELLGDLCESQTGPECPAPQVRLNPGTEWQINHLTEWIKNEVGAHLLDIEEFEEDGQPALRIFVPETYKAARILSRHTGQKVNPDYLPEREDSNVAEVAVWARNDERWSEELVNAADAEEFFLDHFKEMHQEYLSQRNDDDDSFELELPEPSEEYVS